VEGGDVEKVNCGELVFFMSDEEKERISHNLWKLSVVVSIFVGFSALASAWVVIPYRVNEMENRLERMEKRWEVQMQLLIRIDERVEQIMNKPDWREE
jgi:hypothetical protein